jgi:hypothetical protein
MKLAATLLALLMAASASAADVAGKWKASAPSPDGSAMDIVFTLKVDGTTLTGTVLGPMGESPISAGKVEGDTLSFDVDAGDFKIAHKGKVTGDSMKLTVTMGDQSFEMTATRVVDKK